MDYQDSILSRTQCPRCLDSGRNNLVNYADGHSHCYGCGHTINATKRKQTTNDTRNTSVLPMFTTSAILGKRGIRDEVIKSYGVTTEQNDNGQLFVVFPLHDTNGSQYTKRRRLVDTTTGNLTRDMFSEKGKRMSLPVFGWNLVKKQKTILITEGETDALIAASRLYGRSDVVVVGLCGATNAERLAAHLLAYAVGRRVVIAFDNDPAGDQALTKLLAYVEKHESDLNILKLDIPKEYKDIGDWCAAQPELDLYAAVNEAQPVSLVGVLSADAIADKALEYIVKVRSSDYIKLQFSPTLSECLRLLAGKLVGIAGSYGEGKSTVMEHIVMEILQQKQRVYIASREMSAGELAIKLLRMVRNQPLDDPNFLRQFNETELADIRSDLMRIVRLLSVNDEFGSMAVDSIDKHIHKLTALDLKPAFVVIDHLLAIAGNTDADTIQDVCKQLKSLAIRHDVCVLLLCHTRKPQQSNKRTIYRPTLHDAFGSGLQTYADSVIMVASDKQKRESYIEVAKVERMGGAYADITLAFADYCLSEQEQKSTTVYDTDEEYDDEEDVY